MSRTEFLLAPDLVPWLAVVPVLAAGLFWLEVRKCRRVASLLGPRAAQLGGDLGRARSRRLLGLHVGGLVAAALAMLGPVWGVDANAITPRGVDILVCLDVSRSMLARDVPPSRLVAAKRAIQALARRARGDRLGLIAFAGEAKLVAPLTQDLESFVQLVDECDPLTVARGGTDLGAALERALAALQSASGDHEVIVLVTDGEDHLKRGLRVADLCKQRHIVVHCAGFGTTLGSKIAVAGRNGDETFLRDESGQDVITALDPASLIDLASATGGSYLPANADSQSLSALYEGQILPMARKALVASAHSARVSWFQVPLLIAFALWLLEFAFSALGRIGPASRPG